MPETGPIDLPLFPLNVVLYPGMALPLRIFEERYKLMMQKCLEGDRTFGVVLIREGKEVGGSAIPFEVGTLARITDVVPQGQGRMHLSAIGQDVFRIVDVQQITPYMVGRVALLERTEEPTSDRTHKPGRASLPHLHVAFDVHCGVAETGRLSWTGTRRGCPTPWPPS